MVTNAGLLITDCTESWQKAAVCVLNLARGGQLIVSIVLTALDSRYLSALRSSPCPLCSSRASKCHLHLESIEEVRWREEPVIILLPIDRGQR